MYVLEIVSYWLGSVATYSISSFRLVSVRTFLPQGP